MVKYQAGEFTIELDLSQPIYEQVLAQVRLAIARGEVELGSKISSIREMAHYLKVNPNTIMRAYQELERDQLIETRRGQGTYVTSSLEIVEGIKHQLATTAIQNFINAMKDLGISKEKAESYLKEVDWE